MRFKKSPQLPGAGRTWAGHHHGSHTPTSTGAILLSKMACQPKHFGRQSMKVYEKSIFLTTYPPPLVNVVCERLLIQNSITLIFSNPTDSTETCDLLFI